MFAKWFFRSLMVSAYLLFVSVASAQWRPQGIETGKLAMAQKLYEQAVTLMDAQKHADACPKLEQVTQLVPSGLGGHETLGQCYEALGRFGSAWEQYTVAESLAHAKGESQRAADMAARAKALEPKVARVTIVVPKELHDLEGLSISRNGKKVEKALWNAPLPVDKGTHVIKAEAPGRQTWSKEVTVSTDGASLTMEAPRTLEPVSPAPGTESDLRSSERDWQKPLGWTSVGVGAASLITSGILSGLAVGRNNASNDGHCQASNNECNATGLSLREQALTLANGATATFVIGGVLAAGGIILLATTPKDKEDQRKRTGIWWTVEAGPTSVGLRGTW